MIVCACELWEEVGGTILNGERGILLPKKTRKQPCIASFVAQVVAISCISIWSLRVAGLA